MQNVTEPNKELDMHGDETGIEKEAPAEDGEQIAEPFNPDDIDVATRQMTVDLLLSRTASKMINLQPDFQRRWGIWDKKRQSRLIESLLLRIPLPVLYAAEDDDESWEIVDGIQRLSTIARFIQPKVIDEPPLVLNDLEFLKEFNGKTFNELSPRLQMRLRETELVIHLIRKGTPPEVKFNIFARINTGGMALSAQELRHAITPGRSRDLLEHWATLPAFLKATDHSVRAIRMDDRELVLRFIAFSIFGVEGYRKPDMDAFLIATMRKINSMGNEELLLLKQKFENSMLTSYAIFGRDAFRKRYTLEASRLPINKAVFESLSVSIAELNDTQRKLLVDRSEEVRTRFVKLFQDRAFEAAISQGTGNIGKVKQRFESIHGLLNEVTNFA